MAKFAWSKNLQGFFSAESYSLKKDGVTYAIVQARSDGGYFAYSGQGCSATFNTHHLPAMTLDAAKSHAVKAVKAQAGKHGDAE